MKNALEVVLENFSSSKQIEILKELLDENKVELFLKKQGMIKDLNGNYHFKDNAKKIDEKEVKNFIENLTEKEMEYLLTELDFWDVALFEKREVLLESISQRLTENNYDFVIIKKRVKTEKNKS